MCSSLEIKFICPLGMLHLIFLETTLSLLLSYELGDYDAVVSDLGQFKTFYHQDQSGN